MATQIGYDELLQARVNQLQEIERQLARLQNACKNGCDLYEAWKSTTSLRNDVKRMIEVAEEEHNQF